MGPPPDPAPSELAATLEHTRLSATATPSEIESLCAEAREHGMRAVCVNGVHVARATRRLAGSGVVVVTVIGFPLGASAPQAKAAEAHCALEDGARSLDVVLQAGALKAGDHALVARDIGGVIEAARAAEAEVKVILETGLLEPDEVRVACRLAEDCGADLVKTCTGFGPRGVTLADVEFLHACVGTRLGIKAAGGVRTAAFARALLAAGAMRLGTSASLTILGGTGLA